MAHYIDHDGVYPNDYCAVIVGAGLYGLTMAERITSVLGRPVLVIERRPEIGGNARSVIDSETNIEYHMYGPHIFHTSNQHVWEYVRNFTEFNDYRHHVWADSNGEVFSLPISLATMSSFWRTNLSPDQARSRIAASRVENPAPKNFEEKALATIGRELYEAFFEGYTSKQWQTPPVELPAGLFSRLPVRFDFNTRYFSDPYEGIPSDGYTRWIDRIVASDKIHVLVNTAWSEMQDTLGPKIPVVYTGPLDELMHYEFGPLGWRTLDLEFEWVDTDDFQGVAQMNYTTLEKSFTRIVEYRHFHPETSHRPGKTIISREYARFAGPSDDPYYPINSLKDRERLRAYRDAARTLPQYHLGGRLGTYKYLDMHAAIASALTNFRNRVEPHIDDFMGKA